MDELKNLAIGIILTPPSPPSSGLSLVVQSGQGTRFPTTPFNATIWPVNTLPTPANAEIVRVTGVASDTFTIVREQESTSARTILAGDIIAASITKKTFDDLLTEIDESSVVRSATVTLTRAQINAINVTPITVVPAVAGKIIVPIACLAKAFADTGFSANVQFTLKWAGHGTDHFNEACTLGLFTGGGVTNYRTVSMTGVNPGATTTFDPVNKAMVIGGGSSTGGGNSTATFTVLYALVNQ
jgi:hypothetical protein